MNTSSSGWLLAIDPGLRCVGVALFKDGVLVRATALRGPADGRGPAIWSALATRTVEWLHEHAEGGFDPRHARGAVVVETMRHNPHGGKSVPVDDLLELAGVAGAIVGRLASWTSHAGPAHVWKGQTPRDIMGARIEAHLRAEGLWSCVDVPSRKTELNDAMHAVGLGRWFLAR